MTLDATPAGTGANSYATLAEAEAYFQDDPAMYAAWAALSEDDRGRALIAAARTVDRLKFKGRPYDPEAPQALAFPRIIGDDVYALDADGRPAVPPPVREAALEQVRMLQLGGGFDVDDLAALGVRSFRMEGIEVKLADGPRRHGLAPATLRRLRPFLDHTVEMQRA